MTRHADAPDASRTRPWWVASVIFCAVLGIGIGGGIAWTHHGSSIAANQPNGQKAALPPHSQKPTTSESTQPTPAPSVPAQQKPVVFTVVGGGDILTHLPVNASARIKGGYNFSPLLAGLNDWVAGADLALCHLEVPVAPEGKAPTGFPMFGAPEQIVDALAKQGWDGCSTASNHTIDRGFAGVKATIDKFDELGLGHVGSAVTEEQSGNPQLYELKREGQTVTVAHLAATYGTNGIPLPANEPWSVTLIDTDELIAQAKIARQNGADVVVVSLHDGIEYQTAPSTHQLEVNDALAKSGEVDFVFGHHAHVPQPIKKLPGGPGGEGMWVAYGLGNLLSNQDASNTSPNGSVGVLARATITKPVGGPARVTKFEWTPTTVDTRGKHRLYSLVDLLKLERGIGNLSATEIKQRDKRVREAVGTEAKVAKNPPTPTGKVPVVIKRK